MPPIPTRLLQNLLKIIFKFNYKIIGFCVFFHTPFILLDTCPCPDFLYHADCLLALIFPILLLFPAISYYPSLPKQATPNGLFQISVFKRILSWTHKIRNSKLGCTYDGKQCLFFCAYFTSLNKLFSVFEDFIISLFFRAELNSMVYKYSIFIICQLIEHLGWSHFLVTVNRAAMEQESSSTKKYYRYKPWLLKRRIMNDHQTLWKVFSISSH